jgi:hypothetical protein
MFQVKTQNRSFQIVLSGDAVCGILWYLLHGLTNSRSFNLHLFSDLFHQAFYIFWAINCSSSPKNFRSVVPVGRLVDFLPLGRIQFLVLLIGPTYLLRSVQTPNQARTRIFRFVLFLDKFIKYWETFGYVDFFVDCKSGFKNTGSLMPLSLTASYKKCLN